MGSLQKPLLQGERTVNWKLNLIINKDLTLAHLSALEWAEIEAGGFDRGAVIIGEAW